MSTRLVILGARGAYLASRPDGWALVVTGVGEVALGLAILTEATLAAALCVPEESIRILADAVEVRC